MKAHLKQILCKGAEFFKTGKNAGELKQGEYAAVNLNIPMDTDKQYQQVTELLQLLSKEEVYIKVVAKESDLNVPHAVTVDLPDGKSAPRGRMPASA